MTVADIDADIDADMDAGTDRGGLGTRDRCWVRLVCVALSGPTDALAERVREALGQDGIGLDDLFEFVLHYAVYTGWPRGSELEAVVRREWAGLRGGTDAPWAPSAAGAPLDRESTQQRLLAGEEAFRVVNRVEAPRRDSPFVEAGVLGFVFGHVWRRPHLTVRERRLVAIGACAAAGTVHPLRHHLRSALESADLSTRDLRDLAVELDGRVPGPVVAVIRDAARLPPRAATPIPPRAGT
ncbi:4-carboxymuconolactone decarboxylase [Frankia sp. EI5c]|uniref:carboxymuconolactone decarboxylase family protein n=1 Tax=Frankia sp. EI5c TaxID=683316 RepID=UPI0007C38242|nr:carboxymuconolactone decarboxylase family protein [Frankia sp. EI5c]OAA18715.1 4-carboxymuconolactone decarboxylase [Frankia sp. EI5c]